MNRISASIVCALLTTVGLPAPTSATAASATITVSESFHRAIDELPLAQETRTGYEREKFKHWVDTDGDCRDTRDEVLAAESRVAVHGCDIQGGLWVSSYDGVKTRDSGSFDIDHLVPLAEAWDSGAKRWNAATRQRYANDLRDARSLLAVTASSNRSKSDRDPAEWMPDNGRCRYLRQWVAVKLRWQLKVDSAEKRALQRFGSTCENSTIRVLRAVIRTGDGGGGGTSTPPTGGGGLDPRFSTCTEAKAHGYGPYRRGHDAEYDWYRDSDSDGVVCE